MASGAAARLTPVDKVISLMALWGIGYLGLVGPWVPGRWRSLGIFLILGTGPIVLRWAAARWKSLRFCNTMASFWLLPAAGFGHQALGPLVDAAHPRLVDATLALADLRLFGLLPAASLSAAASPVVTEALLVCYYGYFLWPLLLGVVLYARGLREAYHHYTLALALTFAATFVGYACMPAVGPRFFLAAAFPHPLEGLWLTPWLDSAMRGPVFMRDCFPSGHTAVTLVVLTFAFRYQRSFFWKVLPACAGLVAATLVGRFHYAVDLLCAVPIALVAGTCATFLSRARVGSGRLAPAPALWGDSQQQPA